MSVAPLPDPLTGEWIWHGASRNTVNGHVFFRREFALTEVPTVAETWVCVHSHFHLYVNGRHVGRGPQPALRGSGYVSYYDVGYCLQVGRNVIGILAVSPQVSRLNDQCKPPAVWCQLNIDETPMLGSNSDWQVLAGDCYGSSQPRVGAGAGFVESVDLRSYPHGWMDLDCPKLPWQHAVIVAPREHYQLLGLPDGERVSEAFTFLNLVRRGTCRPSCLMTHVCPGRVRPPADGVYAAETWVNSEAEIGEVYFELYADDPYLLYVNDHLVKSQGARHHMDWADPAWNDPRPYQQAELADPPGRFYLGAGSNRILFIQRAGPASAGATFLCPGLPPDAFKFARGEGSFSLPGWTVAGPLRLPFAHASESLDFDSLDTSVFFGQPPVDTAAILLGCEFLTEEETEMPVADLELKHGEFAVVELERYLRGCPEFRIQGTAGDILDVVFGDAVPADGPLATMVENCRRVATLTLTDDAVWWRLTEPQGMRCLMFVARQASGTVSIEEIGLRRTVYRFKQPGLFSCSEELLNQIWQCGLRTLEGTYDGVFNSAGGPQSGQFLADAMIQALTAFPVLGSYDPSAKALREFARAQFETGEMPAIVPSDLCVQMHDFALLWPGWFEKHILHSGDNDLLEELLPNLHRLLLYYETIARPQDMLLSAGADGSGMLSMIDYDPSLDHRGIPTSLNALYCMALLKSEWLFQTANQADAAHICHERAAEIARAIRLLTWNEDKGLFADSWNDNGLSPHYSMQANVLALYSGIANRDQAGRIFDNMFLEYAPFHKLQVDAATETPYFKYFMLDTMFSAEMREWALDYIRYYWGNMLARGAETWWMRFSPQDDRGIEACRSACHGFGVSPNYFLMTEVVGVRPATPGYRQIYLNPLLSAVEWVKAQVPTPHGLIHVEWGYREGGDLEIVIESKFPVEVAPLIDHNIARDAIIHVNDEVTILDTESGPANG